MRPLENSLGSGSPLCLEPFHNRCYRPRCTSKQKAPSGNCPNRAARATEPNARANAAHFSRKGAGTAPILRPRGSLTSEEKMLTAMPPVNPVTTASNVFPAARSGGAAVHPCEPERRGRPADRRFARSRPHISFRCLRVWPSHGIDSMRNRYYSIPTTRPISITTYLDTEVGPVAGSEGNLRSGLLRDTTCNGVGLTTILRRCGPFRQGFCRLSRSTDRRTNPSIGSSTKGTGTRSWNAACARASNYRRAEASRWSFKSLAYLFSTRSDSCAPRDISKRGWDRERTSLGPYRTSS